MNAIAQKLLARVGAYGGRIWLDGEMVRLKAPAPLPDELQVELRTHKPEIVAVLSKQVLEEEVELHRRVTLFRDHFSRPGPKLYLEFPGVETTEGACSTCGGDLSSEDKMGRCRICVKAGLLALGVDSAEDSDAP